MQYLFSIMVLVIILITACNTHDVLAVSVLDETGRIETQSATKPITKPIVVIAVQETEKQAIRQVIEAMNRAVTNNDLAAVLATFDDNALKMDLFPAHYPMTGTVKSVNNYPLTADLKERWQTVFAIMLGRSYERIAEQMVIQIDGVMATAWVHIRTKTLSREDKKITNNNHFYELLVLKKNDGQWKIMLTSNNRHDR